MKNFIKMFGAFVALLIPALPAAAQVATPSTTLCAAQNATQNTICLTSTTGVTDQTGIYADGEYELVSLGSGQTVCSGPCTLTVSRNNRNAGSGPTAHGNALVVWIALTPSQSKIPGANGFSTSSTMKSIGPCTRSAQVYLPAIYVNRNIKRDCNALGTGNGVWVDYAPSAGLDYPSPSPFLSLGASGALSISSGNYLITKSTAIAALTLAAPTAGVQDGMVIQISSTTAFAHTLTATGLLQTGGAASPYTTATFGVTSAFTGASLTLRSWGGFWFVVAAENVTFS